GSKVAKPKAWRLCNVDQSCRNLSPIISLLDNPEVSDMRRAPCSSSLGACTYSQRRYTRGTGEGVHHGYESQYLPTRRRHWSIESIARVGGTSDANRLGQRAEPTPARRFLAARNRSEFQNTREISRFPNCSNSDEKRHTNATAESRGTDLHSAIEGTGPYTFGRSESDRLGLPFVGAGLRGSTRCRSAGRECLAAYDLLAKGEGRYRRIIFIQTAAPRRRGGVADG